MLDLAGKTLLERVYETVVKSDKIDQTIIATSHDPSDDIVEKKLKDLHLEYFRGDLHNVLKRFYDAAHQYRTKHVVRITADNPLMDSRIIDELIYHYEDSGAEYSMFSNAIYGLSAEVFSYDALRKTHENSQDGYDKEHVTPYMKKNCKTSIIDIKKKYRNPELSATIDTLSDYIKMQKFYLSCKTSNSEATIDSFIKTVTDAN